MYLLAATSVVIECSRERVFQYAANLANFAEWFPGVLAIKARDQVPFTTVGKLYDESVAMPLRGRRAVVIRVMEVEPQRRLVTEGALPLLLPRMEIEFFDAGPGACKVQWRMLSRNSARLSRWTVLPIARLTLQRRAEAAMRGLKQNLESGR